MQEKIPGGEYILQVSIIESAGRSSISKRHTCRRAVIELLRRHLNDIDIILNFKSTHVHQIEEHIHTRKDERQQASLHCD